MQVLIHSRI